MQTHEDETKCVCRKCIGDSVLANEVAKQGSRSRCSYCRKQRRAVPLGFVAERIHDVLQEHFELVRIDFSWQLPSSGFPVTDLISDIGGLNDEIARDVRELLSARYGFSSPSDGGYDSYEPDAEYEEAIPNDWYFQETWEWFRSETQSRARFFNADAEEALSEIFGDLSTHTALGKGPVICEVGPKDADFAVWRARTARCVTELKNILKSPARELGPPPPRSARGGRMNAEGIPVFYGALEKGTCVSEARAPVGSYVVLARFRLLRPMRLLDFDVLSEVYVEGSYFDSDYKARTRRAAFLKRLVHELSRPVMPQDETREYVATQVVAEFLAHKVKPELDGIIIRSSQTGGKGRNLVLFNRASRVEEDDTPKKRVKSVQIDFDAEADEEDDTSDIIVFETVLPNPPEEESEPKTRLNISDTLRAPLPEPLMDEIEDEKCVARLRYVEPTLRLDRESVVVLNIKRVKYKWVPRNVRRYHSSEPVG